MSGSRALTLSLSLLFLGLAARPVAAQESAPLDTSGFEFQEFSDTGQTAAEPPPPEEGVHYAPYVHYNRVDQWAIGGTMGFKPTSGWYPRFDVKLAYTFNRDHRGLYVMEGAQPILPQRRLLVGAQVRRFTDSKDDWRVGSLENLLSGFFFHYDYEDWYEASGTTLFLEGYPGDRLTALLSYEDLGITSIPNTAPGSRSVFRRDAEWRPNPAVVEGHSRVVNFGLEFDGRDVSAAPRRGEWLRLGVASTGPQLRSDFTYTRFEAEARGYLPLNEHMGAKARVMAGTTGAGTLTTRDEFAVGGISTLRAHNYKEHRGDHMFLANAEYGMQVWRGRQRSGVKTNVWLLAFTDLGQAWDGPSYDIAHQPFEWDGGLGLSISDNRVQLYAAHNLHDSDSGIVWSVRLSSPF